MVVLGAVTMTIIFTILGEDVIYCQGQGAEAENGDEGALLAVEDEEERVEGGIGGVPQGLDQDRGRDHSPGLEVMIALPIAATGKEVDGTVIDIDPEKGEGIEKRKEKKTEKDRKRGM